MSRLDLAKIMGVADGTLGRIKYGTGNPTVEVLDQIASFFRIPTWKLLQPDLGESLAAPDPAQTSPADAALLNRAISTTLDVFRSLRVLPNDETLAAAITLVTVLMQERKSHKEIAASVDLLLRRASSQEISKEQV